jgi:uncharacterized membrane protein YdbT with pleckstrin-like domain
MQYEKIWQKVLSAGEKVEYEFSVSNSYRAYIIVCWLVILGLYAAFMKIYELHISYSFTGFVLALVLFWWYYAKVANAYAFTNKRVIRHTGWLSTKTITIDYDKITDVTVRENFLERSFSKSGALYVNTAGGIGQEVVLKHINSPYEAKKKLDMLRG